MRCIKLFLPILLLHLIATAVNAQQTAQKDSLVRLIEARSASLMDTNGVAYRKIIGPARFLHNDTYLLCDTAIWEVESIVNHHGSAFYRASDCVTEGVLKAQWQEFHADGTTSAFITALGFRGVPRSEFVSVFGG